jgi:DNA-binding transcriptional LysR family regulator
MILSQLRYLVALSQTRHFARAASLCQVSQPALSTGIRQLERELDITMVQRGQRFQGFTPEGERVLVWARRMLSDWEGLRESAASSRERLEGTLRIGVIPTALSLVARLTAPLQRAHPDVSLVVLSLPTQTILQRLDTFELDMALLYHRSRRQRDTRARSLYRERYVLLAPEPNPLGDRSSLTWRDAAGLPLCLLTTNMRNRQIIESAFKECGAAKHVVVETDSIVALCAYVRETGLFSVLPHSLVASHGALQGMTTIPLLPEVATTVDLVAIQREAPSPIVDAVWRIAEDESLDLGLDKPRL